VSFAIEDLIPIFVFGGICAFIWAMLTSLSNRNSRAEQRLDNLTRPATPSEQDQTEANVTTDKVHGILEKAIAFSKPLMPQTELEQNKLRLALTNAGFRSDRAVSIFLGIKFISLMFGVLLAAALYLAWQGDGVSTLDYVWLALIVAIGMYMPGILLWFIKRKRQQEIFLSLPDALDLMVVCVESGLGLDAAMRKVCDEMKIHAPVICEELAIANFQLQVGRNRRDVLHDLGVRTGVDDVRSLAAILIQADRFGSSVAQALRVQSDSMRTRRKQLAEEKAAKTAVQLIFPLVLFIFPGIFVVLVGPAAINISNTLMK
jgi:tight adherence protein C